VGLDAEGRPFCRMVSRPQCRMTIPSVCPRVARSKELHDGSSARSGFLCRVPNRRAAWCANSSSGAQCISSACPRLLSRSRPGPLFSGTLRLQGRGRRPLEDKSDLSVLRLHPVDKKALRLYAVENGVKVHDLLQEAIDEWAASRGLAGPWRVPSAGPARHRRGGAILEYGRPTA
jgi:hypothetical protein